MRYMFKFFIPLLVIVMAVSLGAQTEEELDKMFLSDTPAVAEGSGGSTPGSAQKPKWDCYGFVENVNHFGMPFTDDIDDYELGKLEVRARVNAKYGIDEIHGFISVDGYLNCHRFDEKDIRDMARIDLQEGYVGGTVKWFQYKLGKQLFSWGTADAFPLTNYLDQGDMRQFFAIDKDDKYRGVWALSMKFLIKDYAIEAAVTPVHSPVMLPEQGSFWEIDPASRGSMDVRLNRGYSGRLDLDKTSVVVRGGGTAGIVDFHLSYFNGMSNTVILKPELAGSAVATGLLPPSPVFNPVNAYLTVEPYYDRVNSIGFDLAFAVEKLSVRMEILCTPDMPAIKEPGESDIVSALTAKYVAAQPLAGGDSFSTASDFVDIKQVPYFAYVVGADYNLWGQNGRVLVEWVHGVYLAKDYEDYIEPMLTKILLMRVEDKFLDERLEAEIGCMLRPDNTVPGWAIMGEIGWDFKNGLTIMAGGFGFFGNDDELISMLENKDMIYTRVRYEF